MSLARFLQSQNQSSATVFQFPSQISISKNFSSEFVKKFFLALQDIHSTKKFDEPLNSPDLLYLNEDELMKTQDLKELFDFQESRALFLPSKVCFIYKPEDFSEIIQNKLLKILEEPANGLSILFICKRPYQLLPTIQSRLLNVRVANDQLKEISLNPGDFTSEKESFNIEELLATSSLADFISSYSKVSDEAHFLKSFLKYSSEKTESKHMRRILNLFQWLQESMTYNNPKSERAFFIYQLYKAIQSHRLPIK